MALTILVTLFLLGAFLLFRNTMNKLQYVQAFRVYWITKNNAAIGSQAVSLAAMHQTSYPWWNGRGVQFRFKNYSFQVGVLTKKGNSLLEQLGGRELDLPTYAIRKWGKDDEEQALQGN